MQNSKQRISPRWPLKFPLRLRIVEKDALVHEELSSETLNISESGLFLHASLRIKVGTAVHLSILIPAEISKSAPCYLHCTGRVIHKRDLLDGRRGYGVQFDKRLTAQQISRDPEPLVTTASSRLP
jgi:hypothetical protein